MLTRKHLVLGFSVFCLTATLLVGVTSSAEYDPWCDINDDGLIDIVDIVNLAIRFGEEGTPINKTELLLELQDRLDTLNGTLEARIPKKGYISVPAAAFVGADSTQAWRNHGGTLYNDEASTFVYFFAAVQLPHGATVTNFTTYWYDAGDLTVYCYLDARDSMGAFDNMAYAHSTGDTGHSSSFDDTINYATVDNSQYGYSLQVNIPYSATHTDYHFHLAIIEYEYQ